MIMLAISGIRDVIRPEVPGAVEKCKAAGITVRMVTGDNKLTALAIAKECNIIDKDATNIPEYTVMEGPEFAI
jgi:P-type E1-E2 ATPase